MVTASNAPSTSSSKERPVAVICRDTLLCQCLMLGIAHKGNFSQVAGFTDPLEWVASDDHVNSTILLWVGDMFTLNNLIDIDLEILQEKSLEITVIIISSITNSHGIIRALKKGFKGYVTLDSDLDILLSAIRLVQAGGIYAPSNSLKSLSDPKIWTDKNQEKMSRDETGTFTNREISIIKLLRSGDPNKTIARKLGLTEGTIKQNIRIIMKKLGAQNRTHISYLTNHYFHD